MKFVIGFLMSLCMVASTQAAPIHYAGDITRPGNYAGSLDINFGWVDPPFGLNSWGDHLDLWQFDGKAGEKISLALNSEDMNLGFSLYLGEITANDLLLGLFNNQGDVGRAAYLTGTSLWSNLEQLDNFLLDSSGIYTLVVGGRDFGGYEGYEYTLSVSKVPEPSMLLLIAIGLAAIGFARRRLHQ